MKKSEELKGKLMKAFHWAIQSKEVGADAETAGRIGSDARGYDEAQRRSGQGREAVNSRKDRQESRADRDQKRYQAFLDVQERNPETKSVAQLYRWVANELGEHPDTIRDAVRRVTGKK